MSDFDQTAFSQKLASFSNDELIAAASINYDRFNAEARQLITSEVDQRGLSGDVQEKIFDVFLNTSGYAGRLILLEEQLMFLSTGLKAASGGGGSLAGSIAADARTAERSVAAERLDFSALENEGSWIYYLDEIKSCEAKSGLLSGKELIFEVEEDEGNTFTGVVKCGGMSNDEFSSLANKIIGTKVKFVAARS